MRTWMLGPDGVWAEVTGHLVGLDPDPGQWDWLDVLADIAGGGIDSPSSAMTFNRGELVSVHGNISDRWVANLIWSTLCTDRIDAVTLARINPVAHSEWITAAAVWTGRPVGDPLLAWQDRRARWMLCAHSRATGTVPLDGVRMVVGAVP